MSIKHKSTLVIYLFLVNILFSIPAGGEELNFGYTSGESIVSIMNKFAPMMDYLSEKLGMKVNYTGTILKRRKGL